MAISYSLIIYTSIVSALLCYLLIRKLGKQNGKLRLPPGSMGLPYIGETLQLYSQDPNVFFGSRLKRYGEIFKTHVLGYSCVMLASPEAARMVLVSEAHLFKPTYPRSKERMIGPWALFFHQDEYHARVRKLVQASLAPESLRGLVHQIEAAATAMLRSWDGRVLSTFQIMKQLSFEVGILVIFGRHLSEQRKNELKNNYFIVDKGYNSFPTNLPGTLYSNAIKARKRLRQILNDIMKERRENGAMAEKDLLSCFVEWRDERGEQLTDDQISDNIIGVLFAAQDTTASVLTWIVKYLNDEPKILMGVKSEQMAIYESNGCGRQPLTWTQTRSMPLTHRVILESLRMASIISFTFREAVADVEYKGYLIPKGWKVMPLFRNIHHNPEFYSEPEKFVPSRFEVSPKPNTFMPFGNGVHSCPGNEIAKLEMFAFIHHLVTQYRFEVVSSYSTVEYRPFPIPKNGLPVRLRRTETDSSVNH
ncbi:LOW QUALITY PROTEIN: abscisic acid 8'-hydroxylase 3-like [Phalaenopsis equestris]|uniref:LOW QUALITY PROTEIN: abscisic acid 8'-hydroxylase 3-like n=1 Tax=Phalaenopsis equestris TaxID=78828 RepID=UPI0009E508B1|nr:LOW QUALITY PROTEIN: abscisic acid 8'-hydroxylase 3-like [Phalaenopsis equestris]